MTVGGPADAACGRWQTRWTWADNASNDAQRRDVDVDRAVARQFAARARQEAVARNRNGDFEGARKAVAGVARRIRKYAGRDVAMRALLRELEAQADEFNAPMAPAALKSVHFMAANEARPRDAMGRSLRSR